MAGNLQNVCPGRVNARMFFIAEYLGLHLASLAVAICLLLAALRYGALARVGYCLLFAWRV